VVEGEITLILDDSEVTLGPGDIVVQPNRGETLARVVFVLVDGEFDEELAATLPGGLEGLMHGGPEELTAATIRPAVVSRPPVRASGPTWTPTPPSAWAW